MHMKFAVPISNTLPLLMNVGLTIERFCLGLVCAAYDKQSNCLIPSALLSSLFYV